MWTCHISIYWIILNIEWWNLCFDFTFIITLLLIFYDIHYEYIQFSFDLIKYDTK